MFFVIDSIKDETVFDPWSGIICRDDFPKAILGKHGEYSPSKVALGVGLEKSLLGFLNGHTNI